MKKLFTAVAFVVASAMLLFSCDKVEGDRYEIMERESVDVEFPDIDKSNVYRKILIDEFTGHMCTNCPAGHAVLNDLHNRYGDTLVMMGIHFGSLARPFGSTFTYDFRTEAGNQLGEYFSISGIPVAIVNMNNTPGGWQREQWPSAVAAVDRSDVSAAIQIINNFKDNELKANVKVTMLKDFPSQLRLAIYLVEDGIVKPQKDGTETIMEYTHNHVFRTALTDPFGSVINNGEGFAEGDAFTYASVANFNDKDWNPNNCSVVAMLYDMINGDVLQVETCKVIE